MSEESKPTSYVVPGYYGAYNAPVYATQGATTVPAGTTVAGQPGNAALTSSQYLGSYQLPQSAHQPVKGESRVEYVPYEKSVFEYEAVQRTEYVPREKKVVDHYAVEHQVEYIPQVFHDRYVEYIPQERVVERIEYQPVTRQIVHPPKQEVQQVQQVQQVPVTYSTVQHVPATYNTVQHVPASYAPVNYNYGTPFVSAPLTSSYVMPGSAGFTYPYGAKQTIPKATSGDHAAEQSDKEHN